MVVDNKIVAGLRFPSARPQRILNRQGSWELIAIPRPIPLPPRSCGPTSRISTNALPRLLSSPMMPVARNALLSSSRLSLGCARPATRVMTHI